MLLIVLCIAIFGSVYSYFLYPALLVALMKSGIKSGNTSFNSDDSEFPSVSLIICAHNEEARIAQKIDNALQLEYPKDRLQIIVTSDASTDRTEEIIHGYGDRVDLIVNPDRKGKEHAQGLAIKEAGGEILAFTDASVLLTPDSLLEMVKDFRDANVGAVSSEDRIISKDGKPVGEGIYLKYEMWLRSMESRVHTLTGLTGAYFGIRAELCRDWKTTVDSDFSAALSCIQNDRRAVTNPKVICIYQDLGDQKAEYRRKIRTIVRGMSTLMANRGVLNPFRYGFASFQIWSHKVMRWLVPIFMFVSLVSNGMIAKQHPALMALLVCQLLFYFVAIMGVCSAKARRHTFFKVPAFFLLVNAAIAHAMALFICGERYVTWQPSKR